jgi:hypothetical protein
MTPLSLLQDDPSIRICTHTKPVAAITVDHYVRSNE